MNKPMLAATAADESDLRVPLYASPKLDGIRGIVSDGRLHSRKLLPFSNPATQSFFSDPLLNGLDGELIVGSPVAKDSCRVSGGAVGRHKGDPGAVLFVFDMIDPWPYHARYEGAAARVASLPERFRGRVVMLPHVLCSSLEALLAVEEAMLEQGYEGLILRKPDGPYKHGRSTLTEGWMSKLKRFEDAEAEFLGIVEQMHNGNTAATNALGRTQRSTSAAGLVPTGTMGALVLRDLKSGVTFTATGGGMKEHAAWWATRTGETVKLRSVIPDCPPDDVMHLSHKRCIVTYKFFAIGSKDKPRHPIVKGERLIADMEA